MSWPLIVICVVAGLVVAWFALLFFAALLEKRHLYELRPIGEGGAIQPMPYVKAMTCAAAAAGFAHAGDYRHVKYALLVSLWRSADGRTVAQISGGTVVGMSTKRTALLSRLASGKLLMTTDEISLPDLTGLYAKQLVLNGSFPELLAAHGQWLAQAGDEVIPHSRPPADELLAMETEDVSRQEAFGYSRFVDRTAGTYRHTVRGALRHCFSGFFRSSSDALRQRERFDLPRPG